MSEPASIDLHQALRNVFGFDEFRPLQEEVVRSVLAGRDTLVVMPTGAGKSLCFQLPAALCEGVTIVISPLVALMRDQVEALRARTSFGAAGCAYLNSLQTPDEQRDVLDRMRSGSLKLLYIAPERFRSQGFQEALRSFPIARFVVDEAHCISEWGHDFRPDYLALKSVVQSLGSPPLLAVTATATLRVQRSIAQNLGMRDPAAFIGGFDRPNLHFAVHRCQSETDRQARLTRALPKLVAAGGSGLIYVATRKQCEEVGALAARALAPLGKKAAAYHAGMDSGSRNMLQSQWLSGQAQVLVATNAFGMGIDKADVRFVVHYCYPDSLESYYQEAGRAGRDGRKSRCVVLYHFSDRRLREYFIENDLLTTEAVRTAHREISARATDDVARIPRAWWSQTLGWSETKTRLALGELERAGLLQRAGETNDESVIRLLRRDVPPKALAGIGADLERQRQERLRRLDEIQGYCKTSACRRKTVLDYFGDTQVLADNKACCDNCDAPAGAAVAATAAKAPPGDFVPMPARLESGNIHDLLHGLDALRPRLGKNRLNKLLRGSAARDVQRFQAAGCPLHAFLRGHSEAQVDALLDGLIGQGLLHQGDEDEYFVCSVTRAGREAWQGKLELAVGYPNVAAQSSRPVSADLNPEESALFESLRAWRRERAGEENLPPYCVLSDRTLNELARARPRNRDELLAVTGIGEAKLARYGADLSRLLSDGKQASGGHGRGASVEPVAA